MERANCEENQIMHKEDVKSLPHSEALRSLHQSVAWNSSSNNLHPTHTTTRSTPLDIPFNMSAAGPQPKRSQYYMDPDNLDEELAKVPLFMSKLPEEENDTLEALQSLVYDGPPEGMKREHIQHDTRTDVFIITEIAENFKNQGNECFKEGKMKYKDAIDYYTRALDVDCKDQKINEACLANRAAVNLELGKGEMMMHELGLTCDNRQLWTSVTWLCQMSGVESPTH